MGWIGKEGPGEKKQEHLLGTQVHQMVTNAVEKSQEVHH